MHDNLVLQAAASSARPHRAGHPGASV